MGAEQDRIRRAALQGLASAEAQKQVQFGEKFADTMGGYGQGAKNYIMGGLGDLIGNVSGFMGDEDTAARMAFESDELYRRGGEFFDQGLAGGENYLDASSMPITPQEESARANSLAKLLLEQDQRNAKFSELVDAGGPYDAGFDPFLQTGKPNISFTRKEGESKDDFRNRILNEQSVTTGAPASSYDLEGPQSLSPSQILQQKINALTDVEASRAGGRGTRKPGEAIGEREQFLDETVPLDGERDMDAASNAFMEALAETNKAKGQEQPKAESRADLLEKYKQEFAEATGIEIDGKPDNSQALMAMGLSLMQNRAGKGFNIGKILNAAGKAGEKAMPYIAKASSEAKAASLAAGKYALGRIQEGESAASAFAAETRKHKNAWDLELMKQSASIEQERIKSGGNLKLENVKPFPIGAGDITVQTGTYQDEKYGKRPVFVNGDASATEITNAYKKYTDGQDNIVLMQESLAALEAQDSTALAKLADRAKSIGVAWGVVDGRDMFGEKGLSSEAEFGIYRQATINAFKKLILQESQVSNLDLTTLFNSFGNADKFMQNPAEARLAINTMMSYFASKKETLQGPLDKFTDRSYFQTDIDFERAQKTLEGIGILQPNAKATSSGSGRYNIDISGAMPLTDEKGNFTNKNISLNDSGQISYTSPQQAG